MVNYRVETGQKRMENTLQGIASEAYKKTARPSNLVEVEAGNSFQREYLQVLVRDYFYSDRSGESMPEKQSYLKKIKASIDGLQLPADVKITKSSEEISLDNFMKLLEEEMAGFEEKKEEKIKEEKEKLKDLSNTEIENIVAKADRELTLADVTRLKQGEIQAAQTKALPPQVKEQIRKHFSNHRIEAGAEHEEIATKLLEKGVELSETVCRNLDELLKARNKELSQERIEELAKQYATVQKIDLSEWNKEYPLSVKQVEEIVKELQGLEDNYVEKIGTHFQTIEEALNNYRNFQGSISGESSEVRESSKSQISFQYIRYKMTLEKALALNSRGIAIDKEELVTIEKELLRLEVSTEQLERAANGIAVSQDEVLTKMLEAEHSLMQIRGMDYARLSPMMLGLPLKQVSTFALSHQAVQAVNRYDHLATAVRSDLGDSMTKAFKRLNSLLLANGIEVSDANLRAVEILGRGQTEITVQNVEAIKELDAKLQLILRGLTPEAVLELLAGGQDFLAMRLDELASHADTRESKDLRKLSDRVAKRIHQMEKNGAISEADKQQLVLVYRLLHAIEKSEGGALAMLMKDKREINLENLYDMARQLLSHSSLDVSVGSDMEFTVNSQLNDLKQQIRSGFFRKKQEILSVFRAAEEEILAESEQEMTMMAKERLQLLKSYSLQEWESLFRAWQKPDLQDVEIYKDFQKIPFLLSDSLRKLEKVSERNDKAKHKLNALKEILNKPQSTETYSEILQVLRDMEADVIEGNTEEERAILSSLTESKKQWSYRQKLEENHSFIQVPVWTGENLRQINVYYPEAKRAEVREQGEIKVLFVFETAANGKISGYLQFRADQGHVILQSDSHRDWAAANKSAIHQVFADNGLPFTSLSMGSFSELSPYQNGGKGLKEVSGQELLEEKERLLPDSVDITEIEKKIIPLAKELSKLMD